MDLDGDAYLEEVQIKRQGDQAWLVIDRLDLKDPSRQKEGRPGSAKGAGQEGEVEAAPHLGRLYAKDLTDLNPLALATCDLDGDGERELFIKVKKSTSYHPEVINRPFFFNFQSDKLYAKWTGSKFGDPFRDAYFIDYFGEGRDLVFIVGILPQGMRISAHAWQGFGFQFLGESPIYPWIGQLSQGKQGIVADLGDHSQEFILQGAGSDLRLVEWPLAEN